MINWALNDSEDSVVLRYPKCDYPLSSNELWRSYRPHWWKKGPQRVLVSSGAIANQVQWAAERSDFGHLHLAVTKPFPQSDLIEQLKQAEQIFVFEESSYPGSVLSQLRDLKAQNKIKAQLDGRFIPDRFISHASRSELLEALELDAQSIAKLL
jgi:1-deoxy-D-xylulose-5-phosphate synthase